MKLRVAELWLGHEGTPSFKLWFRDGIPQGHRIQKLLFLFFEEVVYPKRRDGEQQQGQCAEDNQVVLPEPVAHDAWQSGGQRVVQGDFHGGDKGLNIRKEACMLGLILLLKSNTESEPAVKSSAKP